MSGETYDLLNARGRPISRGIPREDAVEILHQEYTDLLHEWGEKRLDRGAPITMPSGRTLRRTPTP